MRIVIKRSHIKTVVNLLVGAGTWKVVTDSIDAQIEPESNSEKLYYSIGSVAIAGVVCDATQAHTDKAVDKLFDQIEKMKDSAKDPS